VAIGLDATGGDMFFNTADPLLARDVDTQFDLYDARVGGGFPAPGAPAGCEGEACQGAPLVQPSSGVPGTSSVLGGTNVPPLSPSSPTGKSRARYLAQAEKLALALKTCRTKHNRRTRTRCESRARKKYGRKSNAHAKGKR
jgi:hypothetical protein